MATAAAVLTPAPNSLLDLFMDVKQALMDRTVNRSREIDALITAVVAGEHVFMLSEPGAAKSMLVRLLMQCIDCNRFSILMSKFTVLEDLYGPISALGLSQDRWEHQTIGYLPWAHLIYLDEAFKANGASLNAELWALNEREMRNGDQVVPIPCSSAFLTSNELPENEALAALYDRIALRIQIPAGMDDSSFDRMMNLVLDGKTEGIDKPILNWDQVEQAKAEAAALPVPPETRTKITELRRKLREKGIEPTNRRWAVAGKILRAVAWLDGAPQVETEHLADLSMVLWDRPEQQGDVEGVTLGLANPLQKKALEMLGAIENLGAEVDKIAAAKDNEMTPLATDIRKKIKRANKSLQDMETEGGQSRRQREIVKQCRTRLDDVTKKMLKEVFDLDEDAVEEMILNLKDKEA